MAALTIRVIDQHDESIARAIWRVQQAAYQIESVLIDYPEFPPLRETVEAIQKSDETFIGCLVGDDVHHLAGTTSFAPITGGIDICRMVIEPTHFRRGIATQLLQKVESLVGTNQLITVSTAEKNLPAVMLYQHNGYKLHHRRVLADGLAIVHFEKINVMRDL